jgi:hypothetical protein
MGRGKKVEGRDDGIGKIERQRVLGVDVANQGEGEAAGHNPGEHVSGNKVPLTFCIVRCRQPVATIAIAIAARRRRTQEGSLVGIAVLLPAPVEARPGVLLAAVAAARVDVVAGRQPVASSLVGDNLEIGERPERHRSQRAEGLQAGRLGGGIVDDEAVCRVQQGSCLGVDGATREQKTMEADRIG